MLLGMDAILSPFSPLASTSTPESSLGLVYLLIHYMKLFWINLKAFLPSSKISLTSINQRGKSYKSLKNKPWRAQGGNILF